MTTVRESELFNAGLWLKVWELYKRNYIPHAYLIYDLVYEYDNTKLLLSYAGNKIKSYVLAWRGGNHLAIHLWGKEYKEVLRREFIKNVLREGCERIVFQIHEPAAVNDVMNLVKTSEISGYQVKVEEFYDMGVTEYDFQAYEPLIATKLNHMDNRHVKSFMKLKKIQGRQIDELRAREAIKKYLYHGVFINNELVSIASVYLRLRDLWVIGDVFTHPDYRGKGYAKAVTSAVTQKAINIGGYAFLHVKAGNLPAIKAYTRLGYKLLNKKIWILMQKDTKADELTNQ